MVLRLDLVVALGKNHLVEQLDVESPVGEFRFDLFHVYVVGLAWVFEAFLLKERDHPICEDVAHQGRLFLQLATSELLK